jgi:hypothetical protein
MRIIHVSDENFKKFLDSVSIEELSPILGHFAEWPIEDHESFAGQIGQLFNKRKGDVLNFFAKASVEKK